MSVATVVSVLFIVLSIFCHDYLFTLATRVDETNESWTTEQNANFLKRDSPSSKEKKDLLRYPKENANKSPHRKARFLGRLAILAGLDGFPSPFKPQSDKSPPNRISPFFAAYYDPFPAISQVYPALVGVTPTTQTDGPLTPELDQQDVHPTEETTTQSEESQSTEEDYSSSPEESNNSLPESDSSESTESSESQEESDDRTEVHKHKDKIVPSSVTQGCPNFSSKKSMPKAYDDSHHFHENDPSETKLVYRADLPDLSNSLTVPNPSRDLLGSLFHHGSKPQNHTSELKPPGTNNHTNFQNVTSTPPSVPNSNITSNIDGSSQHLAGSNSSNATFPPNLPLNNGPYGYYGGAPQNVQHVQLTYPPYQFAYPSNTYYNVPFNRPANFHPYQPRPPVDGFYGVPSNTFSTFDSRMDYFRNHDYNNFVPSIDNAPYYNLNGFRPMI